jgi:hypothetical protein
MVVMEDREDIIISRLEAVLNRPLTEEDKEELKLWDRGRVLGQIVHTDAWAILLDTIKVKVDRAVATLLDLPPGHPDVPTAHAAASALTQFSIQIQQDVNDAIAASMEQPQVLREAGKVHTPAPPDSM